MKKWIGLFGFILFASVNSGYSQDSALNKQRTFKVGVFAPLYLDSVFSEGQLRNEKVLPKFIMPALEFVQGAKIAFDTFLLYDEKVEVTIYDTRSYTQPLSWHIRNKLLDSLNLIIGSVKDADFRDLADFAARKKIPFISSTYPNDGGVTANPYLAIMNSTLKAHCEGIFGLLVQNHSNDKIYLIKKKGVQEDKIAGYLKTLNEQEGRAMLSITVINADSNLPVSFFKYKLDTTRNSVIIGGSLDEGFAKSIVDASFAARKNNSLTVMGMPNWDGFKFFYKKDAYKDFPILFTTPYYNAKNDRFNSIITSEYLRLYKGKPSDMAYKGFEAAHYFTSILIKYPNDFMAHLNDKTFKVFSDFNFRPVYLKEKSNKADYYENKHLYVMKILNGVVAREW